MTSIDEQIKQLESQYTTAKQSFRSAMIAYETQQTDESYRIFEEEKARMRGIFSQLDQLDHTVLTMNQQMNYDLSSQLIENTNDEQTYQTVYDSVSQDLDQRLASYPLAMEVALRERLAFIHLGIISVGVFVVLYVLFIHSRAKPSQTRSEPIQLPNPVNIGNQVKQTTKQVVQKTQQLGKQYGAKTLEIADKAVVAGKKQGQQLYNQALNLVFGKPQ